MNKKCKIKNGLYFMTSYICRVRENKSVLIFSLVNEKRMMMLQTEIVNLERAVMGKMTRSVLLCVVCKGNSEVSQ